MNPILKQVMDKQYDVMSALHIPFPKENANDAKKSTSISRKNATATQEVLDKIKLPDHASFEDFMTDLLKTLFLMDKAIICRKGNFSIKEDNGAMSMDIKTASPVSWEVLGLCEGETRNFPPNPKFMHDYMNAYALAKEHMKIHSDTLEATPLVVLHGSRYYRLLNDSKALKALQKQNVKSKRGKGKKPESNGRIRSNTVAPANQNHIELLLSALSAAVKGGNGTNSDWTSAATSRATSRAPSRAASRGRSRPRNKGRGKKSNKDADEKHRDLPAEAMSWAHFDM